MVMFQDFLSRFLHCADVLCDEPVLLKTSEYDFGTKTIIIHVYVKMDAPDPLLLSMGVCRQLTMMQVLVVASQIGLRGERSL